MARRQTATDRVGDGSASADSSDKKTSGLGPDSDSEARFESGGLGTWGWHFVSNPTRKESVAKATFVNEREREREREKWYHHTNIISLVVSFISVQLDVVGLSSRVERREGRGVCGYLIGLLSRPRRPGTRHLSVSHPHSLTLAFSHFFYFFLTSHLSSSLRPVRRYAYTGRTVKPQTYNTVRSMPSPFSLSLSLFLIFYSFGVLLYLELYLTRVNTGHFSQLDPRKRHKVNDI